MTERACTECHFITDKNVCPVCNSQNFADKWKGIVYVFDISRSEIAKKMGLTHPGKYALRVR